jgi:NAD(P)-dependent dehydrogenase (short-subunit alcohol dehydrogenase family)
MPAPVARAGEPGDIANVITFLASEESGFMTGQLLHAGGGRTDFLTPARVGQTILSVPSGDRLRQVQRPQDGEKALK